MSAMSIETIWNAVWASRPRWSTALEIVSGCSITLKWLSAEPIEVMIPSPTRAMIVSSVAPPINCCRFVRTVTHFPGDAGGQFLFFLLVNAALTAVCLGISALARTADQASLASIYLVGFQLPLSGAVLALPTGLDAALRPFIAAYWSWSGALQSLRDTRYYDVLEMVIPTTLSAAALCVWVLVLHIVFGIFLAWLGCLRAAWDR